MITTKQKWALHSYQIFLTSVENGDSPFSVTSYDHTKGQRIEITESEIKPSVNVGKRLTKEQKPEWKRMYSGFVRQGMKINQAKRKASGILRGLTSQEARGHKEELGIIDTITTIIEPEAYNPHALFMMQQFMERNIEHYLKWFFIPAAANDIYADFDTEHQGDNRQFEWKLFDEDGELRYWLVYEKGQITKRQMWESFDFMAFKLEIRSLSVWE